MARFRKPALILAAVMVLAGAFHVFLQMTLVRSGPAFARLTFGAPVPVLERRILNPVIAFSDPSAIWVLDLSDAENLDRHLSAALEVGHYPDDREYFADYIRDHLGQTSAPGPNAGYWHGEILLEAGTICPRLECRYTLFVEGDRGYLLLWKI